MPRPLREVDVFTTTAYTGNPVAVVHDADGLSSEEMQRFANWMNFSETTFLLPPEQAGADYRVRIFTPVLELPFAGHPTLGTCHAWLEAGGQPKEAGAVRGGGGGGAPEGGRGRGGGGGGRAGEGAAGPGGAGRPRPPRGGGGGGGGSR